MANNVAGCTLKYQKNHFTLRSSTVIIPSPVLSIFRKASLTTLRRAADIGGLKMRMKLFSINNFLSFSLHYPNSN